MGSLCEMIIVLSRFAEAGSRLRSSPLTVYARDQDSVRLLVLLSLESIFLDWRINTRP
jgi:hypothetical protein